MIYLLISAVQICQAEDSFKALFPVPWHICNLHMLKVLQRIFYCNCPRLQLFLYGLFVLH